MPASQTEDFFRGRLDQMIDLRHPLAVLSTHMPWQEIEASLARVIARKVRAGKKVEYIDLFGPLVQVSGDGVSNAGRCKEKQIELRYIQPGKPSQNAFIERFNRIYRHAVLNAYLFDDLDQVQDITNAWTKVYNEERHHSALGKLPPRLFTQKAGNSPPSLST